MSHTLCEYVFSSVFIDRGGEVYSCCHKQPGCYGNIYDSPLSTILSGTALSRKQELSRAGRLDCFAGCNLLSFTLKQEQSGELLSYSSFPIIRKLTLALGWFCNINCVMCPQDHAERNFLDVDVLKRNIDWRQVQEIICEGGEPLAAPTVWELWTYLISLGKKVNFVTNGLIMTAEKAARIAAHSDYIYISFNAATAETYARVARGGSWSKLLTNLGLIHEAKRAAHSQLRIIGHFTIVEENIHELPAFLDLAVTLGLDIVNFGYNRIEHMGACIDQLLQQNEALRDRLSQQVNEAALRASRSVIVDCSRLQYLGLLSHRDPRWLKIVTPSGM
jgi:MoaA/NifB/PqqE/SkfB family radical SAM enzyme